MDSFTWFKNNTEIKLRKKIILFHELKGIRPYGCHILLKFA